MKRIANIVFYKFNGERPNMKQACIFYTDGTVKNSSYEDGLEACQEIVERYNVTSKAAFKEMINNQAVYVMSGREFEARFQSFISREDVKPVTDLVPVQPQRTDVVPYQKVYRPNNNKPVDNKNNDVLGLNNSGVPADFMRDIEEEIENRGNKNETPEVPPVVENDNDSEEVVNNFTNRPDVNSTDTDNGTGTPAGKEKADVRPVIIPPMGRTNNTNNSNERPAPKGNGTPNNARPATPVNPVNNNPTNNDQLDRDFVNGLNESQVIPPVSMGRRNDEPIEDEGLEDEEENVVENPTNATNNARRNTNPVVVPPVTGTSASTPVSNADGYEDYELEDEEEIYDDGDIDADIEDEIENEQEQEQPKKENGFVAWIKRGIEKVKNWKLVKKITTGVFFSLIHVSLIKLYIVLSKLKIF